MELSNQSNNNNNNNNNNNDINEYIKLLTETELLILELARNHLESSFDIEKSIGYLEFQKNKSKTT